MAQPGAKLTSGGCLAPKASDEDHCSDGRNQSGGTPTPTLLFSLSSLGVSGMFTYPGELGIPTTYALSVQDGAAWCNHLPSNRRLITNGKNHIVATTASKKKEVVNLQAPDHHGIGYIMCRVRHHPKPNLP